MKANEARKIAQSNYLGSAIEAEMQFIYALITSAAKKGEFQLIDPVGSKVSSEHEQAIYQRLRREGYEVTEHPDPDPGHPCSHPYTEVKWK